MNTFTPYYHYDPAAGGGTHTRRWELRERDHRADDQATQRERRRKHLVVVYDERFTLSHEVAAILDDLPARIMADSNPPRWADRVHESVVPMREALAAIAMFTGAPAPEFTMITPESVTSGSWAVALVDAARTLDEPLSAALASGKRINGLPLADRLVSRLRELDQAARNLAAGLRAAEPPATYAGPSAERVARDRMSRRHADELAALRAKHRAERQALRHG